jgi:DNA polymerase-3 subunit delta'
MAFKDVLGHSMAIHRLQNAIRTDKVVQSYLFAGNEGIGKRWAAVQFSKALNCLNNPVESGDACDRCLSCRKIDDGVHPDLLLLEPENQAIKVDQVRQMQKVLAYKPYEGRRRVCIIAAADRMAPHMSNILLKTLEEPPLHTVIVLLARHPRLMLPTILSRCQLIRFHPLPVALVSQWLSRQQGLDEKEAHLLAGLSDGSPGKALELREQIRQIPREKLLREWLGPAALSFEEMEGWVEAMPSERTDLMLILEVAKTLLRDLVIVKTLRDGSRLIHTDLQEDMTAIASKHPLSTLLKRVGAVHQTLMDISPIRGNASVKLSLEALMLSWAEG